MLTSRAQLRTRTGTSKGLMQQKVDLSKVIDNQYVEYALEILGKYQP